MAQCFRFGCRRCSPLNWALYALRYTAGKGDKWKNIFYTQV
ncbi:acetyltransferase [Vibrio parahaemolyticus]|nr:acetyltransferase [Vibrio parahaemolyticus]